MYNSIKDVVKDADGQVVIGEVNQDATAQNIQQRGTGFINKMIELLQADGKTVAVSGNEFYVNAAEGADADAKDADVVIQVAVPAQTTVELCSTEAQAILPRRTVSQYSVLTRFPQRVFLQQMLTLTFLVLTRQTVM